MTYYLQYLIVKLKKFKEEKKISCQMYDRCIYN